MSSSNRIAIALFLILALTGLAGCSKPVEIGVITSESGAAKIYGDEVGRGLELALEEINAAGGYKGKPIQLIYKDDETKPSVARHAITSLLEEDKVRLLIGGIASPVMLEIAPIANEAGVVLISPTASNPAITQMGHFIFRIHPSDILEGTNMAELARDLGIEKMAIFAVDNQFGAGLTEVFSDRYQSKYRKILKTFEFPESGSSAFAAMVDEVKELSPEGVYIVGYMTDVAEITRMLRDADVDAVIIANSGVTGRISEMIGDAAENMIYPQPNFNLDTNDEDMRRFITAFRARYGEPPQRFAALGYDTLRLLYDAMVLGGNSHPDTVRASLRQLKDYQGASGRINFDENGDVVQYPRLFIIRDGKPIPYQVFLDEGGTLTIPGR
ncbi:MAG: ABC transporter substrate-binding protein [Acidobacteria bacterium]|uniref:ABC transporter substrate-binding protein n=1 Tax=Candidatus Polarisedimenticola svalbardensis TaxID=2886004 RepID=A0A8J7CM94_9BACT|nr:ABC transporter substrate-binding protein [Candidatus Polarisedimenticola svalbardensis]